MAANIARSRQDFPGQYRSGGSQLVGNTINTEGGPIYLTSDSMSNPVVVPSDLSLISYCTDSARNDSDQQCLQALLVTDPRVEKTRISLSKDALLDGSCTWVLSDPAFVDWWNRDDIRILWIHGDPGKGKTMMAMALVDEILTRLRPPVLEKSAAGKDIAEKGILAYFFCQGTIDGLNDAISVLRGLIYVLVQERRDLLYHVTKIYNNEGSNLFEGSYGLCALWKLLLDIIRDPLVPQVYLMIDALDECSAYQVELLRLLTEGDGASCSKVKWLITSRNEPQIQEMLDGNDRVCQVSLESYSQYVSDAVRAFIDFKIQKLKKYNDSLREAVGAHLHNNANGTFLWVALVCQRLEKTPVRKTLSALKKFPPGLEPLYGRMFRQIWHMGDQENVEYYRKILCAAILAYRPLHLNEFVFVAKLPDIFSDYLIDMKELVALCGSFLIIRDDVVYFVHQSAKDYLNGAGGSRIFPRGPLYEHKILAHRSAALISNTLKTDICGLQHPGTLREEVGADRVSRCITAHVQYACSYWIDHLLGRPLYSSTLRDSALLDQSDEKVVYQFFCQDLLHWLEAVSLMGKISDSIMAVMNLESCLVVSISLFTSSGVPSHSVHAADTCFYVGEPRHSTVIHRA
jgi:NACHT domain